MALTNESKPSTSYTNSSRIASYETWDTISSTWDTETRTWDDMGSLIDNIDSAGVQSLALLEDNEFLLFQDDSFVLLSGSEFTNVSKP